ncbi:TonB-dependent receptor domain-containing protein [Paremcibacter congregatus]|uniref:TonB-dependent receptor n=1 Tax=Paremcibacter congregatus TaxID=2043170 RepID=A0A2G4YW67_9PROT|nr:TonB-dependent receptor [Paremcibacter congregatus]PHZ86559.1 TonB-dependent receptor [Paremcibacter congregatus]QDE26364.1 TonB-dependent receptor [Paremcibacter congregatus]
MEDNKSNALAHIYAKTLKASRLALIGTASVMAMTLSTPVSAQEFAEKISIDAQSLDLAILSLSRQTGVTILIGGDVAKGKRVTALQGNYTPQDALQHLLMGSGLTTRLNDDGTYVVVRKTGFQKISYNTEADYQENLSSEVEKVVEEDEGGIEEVVITGSRIRRSEFNSASPIQVISGDISREMGIFDTADMLRQSTVSNGIQVDNSMGGFVLDNGPGAATADFRGLGAGRTLVMINGRRVAPAGVGGAPVAPDLNLIPNIMIDRIEALLDGASTVYGSDAVAGVANIILRKDFDGLDVEGNFSVPQSGGGKTYNVGAMWGKTFDRGFISIGGEYYEREVVKLKHNRITRECDEVLYEYEDGSPVNNGRLDLAPGTTPTKCGLDTTNRIFLGGSYLGNIWYSPGSTNIGVPNFSETVLPSWGVNYLGTVDYYGNPLDPNSPYYNTAFPFDDNNDGVIDGQDSVYIDSDGDGLSDVDINSPYFNKNLSPIVREGDFVSNQKRWSVYLNGEYNLGDASDSTVYVEAMFAKRSGQNYSPAGAQFFPDVPFENPTNPCNFTVPGGSQCQNIFLSGFAANQIFDATPIISIQGDRDLDKYSVNQYRVVGGVRGDITAFGDKDWKYDVYGAFSRSKGTNTTQGVHDGRLMHSLNTTTIDGSGALSCPDFTDERTGETMACVPVDMFASNIYQPGAGKFSDAEEEYLFVDRVLNTTVKQTMISAVANGELFDLPWNDTAVPLVVGYEHRRDTIDSYGNDVASLGLLSFFFSDQGAGGNDCDGLVPGEVMSSCPTGANLNEFFAETELQLVRGKPMVEELTVTGSARYSKHSLYDGAWTYAVKGVYRPVDWLTFRGTYGTSYRAPNARELFLRQQTGFPTVSDPCQVPTSARQSAGPGSGTNIYDPSKDSRVDNGSIDRIVEACAAQGIDALTHNLQETTQDSYSVESASGGATTLSEETSRAFSYGFVFEQPWSEAFDLSFSVTYSDIEITNSIEQPGAQLTVNRCFNNVNAEVQGQGYFCDQIARDEVTGNLDLIQNKFLNIGLITYKGYDFNMLFKSDFEVNAKTLGMSLDIRATNSIEQITQVDTPYDAAGDPTNPKWRATGLLRMTYGDFGFNWQTRWIQGSTLQENARTDFTAHNTCPNSLCRPTASTNNYDVHNISITWTPVDLVADMRVVMGINNVFDTMPTAVDGTDVFAVRNFPVGVGYDVYGRTFQVSISKKF